MSPSAPKREPLKLAGLIVVAGGGALLAILARLGLVTPPGGLTPAALCAAGVMLVMAAFWILEAAPLAATALLPIAAFPLLGVMTAKEVAKAYANSTILLFMGGFFLARGLERWRVPQAVALLAERATRGSALMLLFGLMGTTALLSMWLSNTATALVMVTVAEAALGRAREVEDNRPEDVAAFRLALLLGVAYGANIGGIATPIGTAPNLLFLSLRRELDPSAAPIPFLEWMLLTAPVVLLLLPAIALLLAKVLTPFPSALKLGRAHGSARAPLGPGGRRALGVFFVTVMLWLFRADLDLGFMRLPGWASLLGLSGAADDATVAMLGAALMFLLPANPSEGWLQGQRLLDWESANRIPWYLLLLFGGGLALADAFAGTGLSAWLGGQLVGLKGAPAWLVVLALTLGMSLLTEVTSNTATTTLVLPVLFAAAPALGLPPLLLMWPATICASAAFILPISTPPNAIVAGAGPVTPLEMARAGVWLNLLAVAVVCAVTFGWLVPRIGLSW